jgi:hypothetical protein
MDDIKSPKEGAKIRWKNYEKIDEEILKQKSRLPVVPHRLFHEPQVRKSRRVVEILVSIERGHSS